MASVLLLLLGFFLVIKGAGFLVTGGSCLAKKLNISELVIGLTVVAFGTSLPELSVNITASFKGSSEIAITNVLGSNTVNILLILGISAIIFPLAVTKGTVWKEIPFSLLAAVLIAVMAADKIIDHENSSILSRIDGIILLFFFVIFLYYSVGITSKGPSITENIPPKSYGVKTSITFIFVGLLLLILGGRWIVGGAVYIAEKFNSSESIIGATIVAIGTSIPELATSVVAAYRKNADIAVGNVIGSNIFNIFFILGLSAVIKPLPFGSGDSLHFTAVIISSLILFICMFTGKRRIIDRWEGWLLMTGYVIYVSLTLFLR